MNLSVFLAQARFCPFGAANDLSFFGGCGTRRICSSKYSLTSSPSRDYPSGLGIPSSLKLHWLKSTFARKYARFIYAYNSINFLSSVCYISGWLGVMPRSVMRRGTHQDRTRGLLVDWGITKAITPSLVGEAGVTLSASFFSLQNVVSPL